METRHLPEFTQVIGAGTGAWNQIVFLHSAIRGMPMLSVFYLRLSGPCSLAEGSAPRWYFFFTCSHIRILVPPPSLASSWPYPTLPASPRAWKPPGRGPWALPSSDCDPSNPWRSCSLCFMESLVMADVIYCQLNAFQIKQKMNK